MLANSDCPGQAVMVGMFFFFFLNIARKSCLGPRFSSVPLYVGYWVCNFIIRSLFVYKIFLEKPHLGPHVTSVIIICWILSVQLHIGMFSIFKILLQNCHLGPQFLH